MKEEEEEKLKRRKAKKKIINDYLNLYRKKDRQKILHLLMEYILSSTIKGNIEEISEN